jgi:hypothetical protein
VVVVVVVLEVPATPTVALLQEQVVQGLLVQSQAQVYRMVQAVMADLTSEAVLVVVELAL